MCQSLPGLQHINGNAHDYINKGKDCIFYDYSSSPDLGQGEAEQSLHRVNQAQVFPFFAAGIKEGTERSGIIVTALFKRQEDVAAHGNGDMSDDAVKIPQLGFSFKVEIVLHHFEEHLDVPSFAVDPNDLLVGKINLGRQDGQPLAFVAVTDKDDLDLLLLFCLDNHTGKNPRLTGSFLQMTEQATQGQPLLLVTVKHLGHVFAHANHRQVLAEGSQDRGESKPAVHQEVVGPYAMGQHSFHHGFQMLRGFDHSLHPALVPAAAFIQLFLDALNPLRCLGRGAQGEIQRQKTHSIGPAQGQEFKSLQAAVSIVVMDPGQQFDHLGTGAIIGAVVDDQYLLTLFAGQYVHEPDHHRHQTQQELAPVIFRILEEFVGGILLKSQTHGC